MGSKSQSLAYKMLMLCGLELIIIKHAGFILILSFTVNQVIVTSTNALGSQRRLPGQLGDIIFLKH